MSLGNFDLRQDRIKKFFTGKKGSIETLFSVLKRGYDSY